MYFDVFETYESAGRKSKFTLISLAFQNPAIQIADLENCQEEGAAAFDFEPLSPNGWLSPPCFKSFGACKFFSNGSLVWTAVRF